MAKEASENKKVKQKRKMRPISVVLYTTSIIVLLIPLLFLGYIYLNAKESSGKPTEGNRFADSLNPAIEEQKLETIKTKLQGEQVESLEVNLISATLRISIDAKDQIDEAGVEAMMNQAYDQVNAILPIDTYFTNNDKSDKMYDLEVHVYNYIPNETKPADGQIYMIKTKTSAAEKANVSMPSKPKNQEVANELLEGQKQAEADAKKGQ